jgi:hypothetical protein
MKSLISQTTVGWSPHVALGVLADRESCRAAVRGRLC